MYEYQVIGCHINSMQDYLNDFGRNGWRLFQIMRPRNADVAYSHYIVMERQLDTVIEEINNLRDEKI